MILAIFLDYSRFWKEVDYSSSVQKRKFCENLEEFSDFRSRFWWAQCWQHFINILRMERANLMFVDNLKTLESVPTVKSIFQQIFSHFQMPKVSRISVLIHCLLCKLIIQDMTRLGNFNIKMIITYPWNMLQSVLIMYVIQCITWNNHLIRIKKFSFIIIMNLCWI